jgi:hypothetical protein
MSAAITKPQSADTTIERSKAPCGTRIGVVADKAATSSVIQALYSVPEVGFAERSPLTSSKPFLANRVTSSRSLDTRAFQSTYPVIWDARKGKRFVAAAF